MKTKLVATWIVPLCAALISGSALADSASPRAIDGAMLVQVIGEVKAVDVAAHRVTVVDAQGRATNLNVGAGMHDLDKLPLGSRVKSTAMQPVTMTPVKNAKLQEMIPGDKQFVAQVASVDSTTGVVMLKDADGLPIEIHARDAHQAAALSNHSIVKVVLKSTTPSASVKTN